MNAANRSVALIAAACLSFLLALAIPERAHSDGLRSLEEFVVMVYAKTPSGRTQLGAGLVVGTDGEGAALIATARHVVYDEISGEYEVEVTFRGAPDERLAVEIAKTDFNQLLDLAVLRVKRPPIAIGAPVNRGRIAEPMEPGEDMSFIGHTEGEPWFKPPTKEKVGVRLGQRVLVESNHGGPGTSGGVAIDESGRIFGIALTDDRSILTILPLSVIADELRAAGLPFAIEEGARTVQRLNQQSALSILDSAKASRDGSDTGQGDALAYLASQGSAFNGADLAGIAFKNADLGGIVMNEARLWLTDFSGADLSEADLSKAGLRFATAEEANFDRADISGVFAPFLYASRSKFSNTRASLANFLAADLREADFSDADLKGAVFAFADLRGARFDRADLSQAHFVGAMLDGARFEGAVFDETNMLAARLNPFELTQEQRAETCQVVTDSETRFNLTERWPDSTFDSGYKYERLDEYNSFFGIWGLNNSLLRPCDDYGEQENYFSAHSAGYANILVDRQYLTKGGRRDQVIGRRQAFIDRTEKYPEGSIVYSAID